MILAAAMVIAMAACNPLSDNSASPLPENLGYLRSSSARDSGKFTVFDADNFAIYRTVELPDSQIYGVTNRLDQDSRGRIWLTYTQEGLGKLPWAARNAALVFSPAGELLHTIEPQCGPLIDIAFAGGRAFILCLWSGFYAQVVVIDTATMTTVKTFEKVAPPAAAERYLGSFFAVTMAEVAGVILVVGHVGPPNDYDKLTNFASGAPMVVAIDPDTLEVLGYHTDIQPGARVEDLVAVDGKAWMLNKFSHEFERPARTDVYVLDPHTLEIVKQFNLPQPFPERGRVGADGVVYIFQSTFNSLDHSEWEWQPGVSRVDPATLEAAFTPIAKVGESTFINSYSMDVYQGRPCITHHRSGLWCMNDDGTMTLEIEQEDAVAVLFAPSEGKQP